jgi:hypothetical protein
MLEQIDVRLKREYKKIAAMPDFRKSVNLARNILMGKTNGTEPVAAKKAASAAKKRAKRAKAKK